MTRTPGFTLIEVLIVLLIVGVLSQIALPRFDAHLQRAHRSQAQQQLLALSQRLAQQHSVSGSFARSPNSPQDDINDAWLIEQGWDRWPIQSTSQEQRYRIRFLDGMPQAQQHTLLAEPVGAQNGDPCGVLMLDQRHVRGAGGVLDGRAELTQRCWSR
jgi:type IV pilus assembly protein PilE